MAFPDSDLQVVIKAYLGADPTADSGTWPAATDLSSRLLDSPLSISLGRQQNTKTAAAGSCTFDLNDSDGYLTPGNPFSPYFDQWDVGMPMSVDFDGVGASPPYGRFRGYITNLESRMVPGVGGTMVATVRVALGGIINRITQGSVAKSAMLRSLPLTSPIAYWPMEGGTSATILTNVVSSAYNATVPIGIYPGQSDGPAGSNGAAEMPTHISSIYGVGSPVFPVNAYVSTGTVLATYHVRQSLSSSAVSWTSCISLILAGGTIARFVLEWTSAGLILSAADASNATIGSAIGSSTLRLVEDGDWHELQVLAVQSGSNVSMTLRLDGTQIATGTLTTQSLGVAASIAGIGGDVDGSAPNIEMCHMLVHSSDVGSFTSAMDGYAGEAAHTRFARICTEEGIPYFTSATDSRTCGPQPVADAVAVLRDLEASDEGVLYELVTAWGFGYRAGSERVNLSAAITIDLATYRVTGDEAPDVLTPIRNNQRLRNEWTISRPKGGSATYKDAANQAKRGRYDDSATVNVEADIDLVHVASWYTRKGTDATVRYRTMPVDLAANNGGTDGSTNLIAPWLAIRPGDRVDRTNQPTSYANTPISVEIEGYQETATRRSWIAALNVEPYEPWRVNAATADSPIGALDGWADYDSCTLAVSVNTSATSWSITCSPAETSDASDYPRRHWIDGELITVTASTGGTSPTWTVTRSSNGVSKSHSSGAAVTLADPLVASFV